MKSSRVNFLSSIVICTLVSTAWVEDPSAQEVTKQTVSISNVDV